MRVVIIGATGTIGKHVTRAMEKEHEVIKAGSKSGDLRLDISSPKSIQDFFEQVKSFDALISVTGTGHLGPLDTITDSDFRRGIDNKLMGQVNLVLTGQRYINPAGSFTLSSGILADEPVVGGSNMTAVNMAIEGFVKAAAIELTHDVRINAVSPGVAEESPKFFPYFPGYSPVAMERISLGFVKCVLGGFSGKIVKVH